MWENQRAVTINETEQTVIVSRLWIQTGASCMEGQNSVRLKETIDKGAVPAMWRRKFMFDVWQMGMSVSGYTGIKFVKTNYFVIVSWLPMTWTSIKPFNIEYRISVSVKCWLKSKCISGWFIDSTELNSLFPSVRRITCCSVCHCGFICHTSSIMSWMSFEVVLLHVAMDWL